MNDKARQYREQLKVETINQTNNMGEDVPEGFDMQYTPIIIFIDDDPTIGKTIEQRLTSISSEVISIDKVIRCISKQEIGYFEDVDMIFIDGFYRDRESNKYAIDFFDMYRRLGNETIDETKGKYKVVVSIDEIETRTRSKTIEDSDVVDENFNISALYARIRKHPRLEWRGESGKINAIIQAIEEYAATNKIYLYKNSEMSLKEWIEYIRDLINKVNNTIQNLQVHNETEQFEELISNIVSEFRKAIKEANKQLGLNENGEKIGENKIKSIENAVECTKMLYQKVSPSKRKLMDLGLEESEHELRELSHELGHYLQSAYMECYKAEKTLEENSK